MKKLGTSGSDTIVLLSNQEFIGLAGKPSLNVPDGENVNLGPIKAKLDLVDKNKSQVQALVQKCEQIIQIAGVFNA